MLISILTPTKNRATSFLPDLLQSIESQKIPEDWQIEHIICDDGSDEHEVAALKELVQSYSITTKLILHKTSRGVASAHNDTLRVARGDILLDIDDDDVLTADSIKIRVAHLMQSDALWLAGNAIVVDEQLRPLKGKELIRDWDLASMSRTQLMEALLNNKAWLWAGTRTYKRAAVFTQEGLVREWDEQFSVASDLDYWLRLVHEVGVPDFVDKYLVYWREKQDSLAINAKRSGLQASMINAISNKWMPVIASDKVQSLPEVSVIMCTYKRPERLAVTLQQLAAQENCIPRLYVWNNNPEFVEEIDKAVAQATINVSVHHNAENIGGFGRFYQARTIAANNKFVIFIDDDVNLGPNALRTSLDEGAEHTIVSFFAFALRNPADYFDRDVVEAGQSADYCGTGGMVVDASIFTNDMVFNCPEKFWFLEDLWLCAVAQKQGWVCKKSAADITFEPGDFKDQWLTMKPLKTEFLQYLIADGFVITGPR